MSDFPINTALILTPQLLTSKPDFPIFTTVSQIVTTLSLTSQLLDDSWQMKTVAVRWLWWYEALQTWFTYPKQTKNLKRKHKIVRLLETPHALAVLIASKPAQQNPEFSPHVYIYVQFIGWMQTPASLHKLVSITNSNNVWWILIWSTLYTTSLVLPSKWSVFLLSKAM